MARTDILGTSLELPDDWMGVQCIWLGPLAKQKTAGLLTMAGQAEFRENIAFHRSPNTKVSAVEYLATLTKHMIEVEAVKKEAAEIEPGTAQLEVITKAPNGTRMRQLIRCTVRKDDTLTFTFSFLEGAADVKAKRKFFDDTLKTLKMS